MIRKIQKLTIQVVMACVLVIAGLSLLFMGFFAVPLGEIHNSVLVAFGEACTFSGALLGIDYTYKYRMYIDRHHHRPYEEDSMESEDIDDSDEQ